MYCFKPLSLEVVCFAEKSFTDDYFPTLSVLLVNVSFYHHDKNGTLFSKQAQKTYTEGAKSHVLIFAIICI